MSSPVRPLVRRALLGLSVALVAATFAGTFTPTAPDAGASVAGQTPAEIVQQAAGGRRPNIVLVMMDDMRADELRYAPNTRRHLRERGIDFRNSFAPYPLCCPARASLLKGTYAHNHRVLYHDAPYGFGSIDDRTTIASRLRNVGYQTGMVGKYLNRYGIQRSKVTGRSSVHYVPRGWKDWYVGLDDGWGGSGGTYSYFNFTQNMNGRVVHHRGAYSSTLIADQARTLIGRYHQQSAPFFLWINPVAPHFGGPAEPDDPRTLRTSTGQKLFLRTPARPGWVEGRFDATLTHAPGIRADGAPSEADVSDKPRNIRRWPEPTRAEKAGMLEMERQRAESIFAWDRQFGRVIAKLKQTGEYRNTILMFTSDNGYYLGEHRMRQGKVKAHEPVLRVPFLVAGPGIQHGARYVPISTFDITATILDAARAKRLPDMDGASRLGQMTGGDRAWTMPVITEGLIKGLVRRYEGFPGGLTTSGLRTGRYKLVMYSTGEGELYDLWEDPNELRSIYRSPEHRRLRNLMVATWKKYNRCDGAACRGTLPAELQTTRGFLAKQYLRRVDRASLYYDH